MKVLVTGHDGYIGTVLTPLLLEAGHEPRRARHQPVRQPRVRRDPGRPRARGRHPRRHRRGARRLRRRHPPRRALQRPARQPRPGDHLRGQPPRERRAGARRPRGRRPALPLLELVQHLRRRRRRHAARRERGLPPGHALRRVEGAGGAGHRHARHRRLHPRLPPQRHRLRRLPPHARRHRGQQPRRLRLRDRRGADAVRRHAVAPARPRRGHRARLHRRARGARRSRSTTRPSTSAATRTTTRSATSPGWSSDRPPAPASTLAPGAGPDTRSYRVDFAKSRRAVHAAVDGADGDRRDAGGLHGRSDLTLEEFLSPRFQRLPRLQELVEAGELDDALRRRVPA